MLWECTVTTRPSDRTHKPIVTRTVYQSTTVANSTNNYKMHLQATYSRGPKRFTFCLRRTVQKRSVLFPLYGQQFLGTLFVRSENGYEYGKSTVAKRKRFWLNERPFVSPRAAAVSLWRENDQFKTTMTYRTVPKSLRC